jgi:Electron transfer DM13
VVGVVAEVRHGGHGAAVPDAGVVMSQSTGLDRSPRLRRRQVVRVLLGLLVVLLAAGLWAFEPWRLWTRSTVIEEMPGVGAPAVPGGPPPGPGEPVVLAEGRFETQEHRTTGTARVIELPDGTRFVRLQDFSTSDGPDLRVWLTDRTAGGEWGKYDDGRYVQLGELKGTDGDQNYPIPAEADLSGLSSVVIWCDRFNVAFGSAPLAL